MFKNNLSFRITALPLSPDAHSSNVHWWLRKDLNLRKKPELDGWSFFKDVQD
ncbi:hypothetical protein VPHK479_0060 [Vibrio phage K479]